MGKSNNVTIFWQKFHQIICFFFGSIAIATEGEKERQRQTDGDRATERKGVREEWRDRKRQKEKERERDRETKYESFLVKIHSACCKLFFKKPISIKSIHCYVVGFLIKH